MATKKKKLRIVCGISVSDLKDGDDHLFYDFGAVFTNCTEKEAAIVRAAANKWNHAIHKGFGPMFAELEKKYGIKPEITPSPKKKIAKKRPGK